MTTVADRVLSSRDANVRSIPLDLIDRGPFQPRDTFDRHQLESLAASLKAQGLLQPIIVRAAGTRYELVVGERRWRAAQLAGWQTIPAVLRDMADRVAAEAALAENEMRVNVNPVATARVVTRLIETFGHTHDDVAVILGIDRSSVSNLLRLLALDPEVQVVIGEGAECITVGHAKVLVSLTKTQQRTFARRIIAEQLSVRQLERFIKALNAAADTIRPAKDAHLGQLELKLTDHIGQRVSIEWVSTAVRCTSDLRQPMNSMVSSIESAFACRGDHPGNPVCCSAVHSGRKWL